VILGTVTTIGPTAAEATSQLDPVDLGTLGGPFSGAADINERGQIVGYATTAEGQYHAVMWDEDGIHDLGGVDASAAAINNHGQIVGSSYSPTGNLRAMLWDNGHATDLGTLAGGNREADAVDINDRGQIVGSSLTPDNYHAFLWENGVMTDLGTLPGDDSSVATAINERGDVVGVSYDAGSGLPPRAVLWADGTIVAIGSSGAPMDINDRGDIAITYDDGRAEVWSQGDVTIIAEPTQPATLRSINNRGNLAGFRPVDSGFEQATLWRQGQAVDLGTLGGPNSIAHAMNERGQIVGISETSSTEFTQRAVLWT
jgi:probable HAF family extracellular repeat protein